MRLIHSRGALAAAAHISFVLSMRLFARACVCDAAAKKYIYFRDAMGSWYASVVNQPNVFKDRRIWELKDNEIEDKMAPRYKCLEGWVPFNAELKA